MAEDFGDIPANRSVGVGRFVAEGTDTVESTGVDGVQVRNLTGLVNAGETLMLSAAVGGPGGGVLTLGAPGGPGDQGVPGLTPVAVYLSWFDAPTRDVRVCINNFNDDAMTVHWKVWAV